MSQTIPPGGISCMRGFPQTSCVRTLMIRIQGMGIDLIPIRCARLWRCSPLAVSPRAGSAARTVRCAAHTPARRGRRDSRRERPQRTADPHVGHRNFESRSLRVPQHRPEMRGLRGAQPRWPAATPAPAALRHGTRALRVRGTRGVDTSEDAKAGRCLGCRSDSGQLWREASLRPGESRGRSLWRTGLADRAWFVVIRLARHYG